MPRTSRSVIGNPKKHLFLSKVFWFRAMTTTSATNMVRLDVYQDGQMSTSCASQPSVIHLALEETVPNQMFASVKSVGWEWIVQNASAFQDVSMETVSHHSSATVKKAGRGCSAISVRSSLPVSL